MITSGNFILIWIINKIKWIVLILLFLGLFTIVFLRWTGYFYNTPLSWKRPEVSLISDSNSDPVVIKNDEVWVNIDYDSHHSNVTEAVIWIDDDWENRQELEEGANVYVFDGLSNGEHQIHYSLEWSIFGDIEFTSEVFVLEDVSRIYYDPQTDIDRTNDSFSIELTVEGDYYVTEDGYSTLGFYYFDYEYFQEQINLGAEITDALYDSLIQQDNVIYEGTNTYYFEYISTASGDVYLTDQNYDSYVLIPAGIKETEDRYYLVLAIPFNVYYFAEPTFENPDSIQLTVDSSGTLTISNIYYNNTNFDNLHYSVLECNVLNDQYEIVDTQVILLDYQENYVEPIVFENILHDDAFTTPVEYTETIEYTVTLQIKCGYNSISDFEIGFNNSPWYSDVLVLTEELATFAEQPDTDFMYYVPNTYLIYENTDYGSELSSIIIDWSSAYFSETVDESFTYNVYWSWSSLTHPNESVYYEAPQYQNVSSSQLTSGYTIIDIDDILSYSIDLSTDYNNGEEITIYVYFEYTFQLQDWWGNYINEYKSQEMVVDKPLTITFTKNP